MAKPSKWFNKLLRRCRRKPVQTNKSTAICDAASANDGNGNYTDHASHYGEVNAMESNKHAIAVAAATAAVAEAALAAAKAAAEVVRLTANAPHGHVSRRWSFQDLAAVKIQSAFRGYLARRALKALKGLVKLQALVRGHFVRKQSADMLRRLQAMARVQHRARSNRALNIDSTSSGKETPRSQDMHGSRSERLEDSPIIKRCGSNSSIRDSRCSEKTPSASAPNWLDNWVEDGSSITSPSSVRVPRPDDEKSDKILEVDSWKPHSKARSRNYSYQPLRHISAQDYYNHSFAASDYLARYSPNDLNKPNASPCAEDTASLKSLHFPLETHTANINSPASRTGSMRRSPKTPSREECSRSYLNGYATFASPSYMANTQSSRAKSRSHSVPRQRGDSDQKHSSIKRSLHAFWESKTSSKRSSDSFSQRKEAEMIS